MIIRIDFKSETPIYLQLSNQIIENIANGNLTPGEESTIHSPFSCRSWY